MRWAVRRLEDTERCAEGRGEEPERDAVMPQTCSRRSAVLLCSETLKSGRKREPLAAVEPWRRP